MMGNFCSECGDVSAAKSGPVMSVQGKTIKNNTSASEASSSPSSKIPSNRGVDYPLQVSRKHTLEFNTDVKIDRSKEDYRGFCLLIHKKYGAILLHCTRKKKKPPHYQLPGGHVDDFEFRQVMKDSDTSTSVITQLQLYEASKLGCARELYEETTIDLRQKLDRILPMVLYNTSEDKKDTRLINEYKHRIFFICEVSDDDFPSVVS
jgi:8-oxo-dGTP pyrophosphatase MutT (NUDIX family)